MLRCKIVVISTHYIHCLYSKNFSLSGNINFIKPDILSVVQFLSNSYPEWQLADLLYTKYMCNTFPQMDRLTFLQCIVKQCLTVCLNHSFNLGYHSVLVATYLCFDTNKDCNWIFLRTGGSFKKSRRSSGHPIYK